MADLSPAAQAVLEGFRAVPTLMDGPSIAGALRAAVACTQQHHGYDVWECDAGELLAIAAELEGAGHCRAGRRRDAG
jgi:hypothetical protein